MGTQTPLESSIVKAIVRKLNAIPGCRIKKHHGSMYGAMEVDLYGCCNGRAVFIEAKQPGKKPTDRQRAELESWKAVGAITGVATSVAEAMEIIAPALCHIDTERPEP